VLGRDPLAQLLDGRPGPRGVKRYELGAALRAGPVRELVGHLPSMRGRETPPAGGERAGGRGRVCGASTPPSASPVGGAAG
jgi:hypothetical protein